jgi:hypothetical protein
MRQGGVVKMKRIVGVAVMIVVASMRLMIEVMVL